ncbi:excisionase family DNA-binding protein [Streptomyces sp. NPDC088354]|uniref:excisionase family DNA-binding protein n=1 Tax=Streptomyces sp. NPDC088354 TaxID=3365856 RepID=UPI0038252937
MNLTTGQAAQALGVSIPTVERLIASGAVPGTATHGRRQVFPLSAAQTMARLPVAPLKQLPGPEVPVLRVGVAERVDEPDRAWIGYSAGLGADQLLLALREWWRCDPDRVAASTILPVTIAGFVVAVLTDLGDPVSDNGGRYARYSFRHARLAGYVTDLTNPVNALTPAPDGTADAACAALLLGTRLSSKSGGPIAYVATRALFTHATTSSAEGEA